MRSGATRTSTCIRALSVFWVVSSWQRLNGAVNTRGRQATIMDWTPNGQAGQEAEKARLGTVMALAKPRQVGPSPAASKPLS